MDGLTPRQSLMEHIRNVSAVDWLWALGTIAVLVVAGTVIGGLLARAAQRLARGTKTDVDDAIIAGLGPPIRWLLPVVGLRVALPTLPLPAGPRAGLAQAVTVTGVLLGGWVVLRAVAVAERVVVQSVDVTASDNLRARTLATQMRGFGNIARFATGLITLGLVLMTFDQVRRLGMSLLASAGVAGVVIGFAAQRSIATVVAGVQIALSQPIRVDDVVIVEGEWGRIEEITLTYVVVKIWDERRLIVPITYFIEKPFQNWTRTSAELLGTIFLYVDYRLPISPLRAEVERLARASALWDGRVAQLVVTEAKSQTLELRALVSAADASKLWDLRCQVREGLVDFIQRHHPDCLPLMRARLTPHDADALGDATARGQV